MPDKSILFQSFEEHTLMWFFISNIFAAFMGAALKILFEFLIPQKITTLKETNEIFREYCHKLLQSAQLANNRIDFVIRDRGCKIQFDNEMSKISFLYAISQYFCWVRIIQENALNKFVKMPRRYRKFYILFFDTHKALCSTYHLRGLTESMDIMHENGGIIPGYDINAIVDKMLADVEDNKTIIKNPIINISEFVDKYKQEPSFRNLFVSIEIWITKITPTKDNFAWNRILVFSIALKIFIKHLDKDEKSTKQMDSLYYVRFLNPSVLERIEKDLYGYRNKGIPIPFKLE